MIQFCCGTGDCTAAGAEKRDDGTLNLSSKVLRDADGNVLVPHSVGHRGTDMMDVFMEDHGLQNTTIVPSRTASGALVYRIGYPEEVQEPEDAVNDHVQKRDCDHYDPDGAPYTKTGTESYTVSGFICDSTTEVSLTNEHSVSQSTTFGSSVSDPFGIVSASISFTIEKEASQSQTYKFQPMEDQCGHVAWTPFYTCTGGTITGCDAGDQKGEVCTAKRIGDDKKFIDGAYHFVTTQ